MAEPSERSRSSAEMGARAKQLTVIAAFAAIAVVATIILYRDDDGGADEVELPTALEGTSSGSDEIELSDASHVESRVDISPNDPNDFDEEPLESSESNEWEAYVAEDWATIGPMDRFAMPDDVLDSMYPEDLSRDDLQQALLSKLESFMGSAHEIAADRRKMGLVELVPEPPQDSDGAYPPDWTGRDSDWPAHSVFLNGDVPDGMLEVVWIPFADHPTLYDTKDEYLYLSRRLKSASEQ